MGMFGYAAGPRKVIVDPYGLTDPLLARLPAIVTISWLPGEIARQVPDGYLESLDQGSNLIKDPSIHAYYDSLRLITQGPLLSPRRWRAILLLNLRRRGTVRSMMAPSP